MPNWCNNVITITGPQPVIANLWEQAQARQALLEILAPEPDYLETPVERAFPEVSAQYAEDEQQRAEILANEPAIREDSWWDWRVQHWGTKWDIGLEGLEFADHGDGVAEIMGSFESAWSPPVGALAAYQERMLTELGIHTDIDLMYYEPGMAFAGRWFNGDLQHHDLTGATADTVVNILGEDLDEAFGISDSMADWEQHTD